MKTYTHAMAAAALARMTFASPIAQGMDLAVAAALPPAPSYTEATGVTAQIVTINPTSLIASALATITDTPLSSAASDPVKRHASVSAVCSGGSPQPSGYGPVSRPDTAAAFAANPVYGRTAKRASTPEGFTEVFTNLNASSSDYGYLGYTTLESYDTASCAAQCQAITDCYSFNICESDRIVHNLLRADFLDFERDPSVDPGSGSNCQDPASTTNIKCAFWGAPISSTTATNNGQWRDDFEACLDTTA